jgi:signal transduction histidine kinase
VTQEPHYYHVPEIDETRSELAVPLRAKGRVIGVLDVQSRRLAAFDEGDVVVLQSLADQAAMAIENARLFEAEQRRAEQFHAINEVGQRITSILDTDELLWQMVRLIRETLGYSIVGIGLVEGDRLVFRAGAAPRGQLPVDVHIQLGSGVTGWVATSGQSLLVPDVSREPRFVSPVPVSSRSELAVPMKTKDAVIGVLNVESEDLNAFDESDRLVLESLASQAAVAIENARLYEQARQLAILEERHRLARDLHDSVTQALYGVTLYSEAAAGQLSLDNVGKATEHLRVLRDTAQEALAEMRLLIYELRPPVLEEEGLVAALQARLTAVEGRVGLHTRLKVEGTGRLSSSVEDGLYHIAQEALNNALKHAHAHKITVLLRYASQGRGVGLEIVDDGEGFDLEAARGKGGLGLSTMQERTTELGGRLSIESSPGEGTRVLVEMPR